MAIMNKLTTSSRVYHNVAPTKKIFPLKRCLSARPGDDEQHIGNQLSRTPDQVLSNHKKWSNTVKKFPRINWNNVEPIGLTNQFSARYELEGLADIHKRSYDANVLVEIRDVRAPASSHHPSFTRLAKHRTHLIAYTHADLIDANTRDKVETWTQRIWPESRSIFVDTRDHSRKDQLHHFDPMLNGLLHYIEKSSNNFALNVGCANVGKSSVLHSLLRLSKQRGLIPKTIQTRKTTKKSKTKKGMRPDVEDVPGKTREITEYMLREKPKAFFMDVPGITPPPEFFRERPEAWFAFGATNLLPLTKRVKEDVTVQMQFCRYVLHCANRQGVFDYIPKLNLDGPTNDIEDCLRKLSNKYVHKLDETKLTLKRCETFLKLYNTGNFGSLVLDDMSDFGWKPFHSNRDKTIESHIEDSYSMDEGDDWWDMYEHVGRVRDGERNRSPVMGQQKRRSTKGSTGQR